MANNLAVLILASGLACLIFIFIVAVFVGLIYFFVRQARYAGKQFSDRPAQQGEEFLACASLRPWSPNIWTDLSSHWDGWWLNTTSIGRSDGYAQGLVGSSQDPKGPGWIAFTIHRYLARSGRLYSKPVINTSS